MDKSSLDRFLTTEPYDGFDSYCEVLIDKVSDVFF